MSAYEHWMKQQLHDTCNCVVQLRKVTASYDEQVQFYRRHGLDRIADEVEVLRGGFCTHVQTIERHVLQTFVQLPSAVCW